MLVARALAPAPGERVLDLCAAPGGKTHPSRRADGATGRGRSPSSATRAAPARSRAPRSGCARAASASRSATPSAGPATPGADAMIRPRARRSAVLRPRDAAGARRPALARRRPTAIAEMAGAQARILAAGADAAPSGRRACLLYLHDLPDGERAPDRRLPRLPPRLRSRTSPRDARAALATPRRAVVDDRRAAADAAAPRPHRRLLHRPRCAGAEHGGRARDARRGPRSTSGRSARTAASRGCGPRTSPAATAASTACTASS